RSPTRCSRASDYGRRPRRWHRRPEGRTATRAGGPRAGTGSGRATASLVPLTVLHTESSLGWGGQEVRIVTEATWLRERGVRVVLAAQPGSRVREEALRVGVETVAVGGRGSAGVAAVVRR